VTGIYEQGNEHLDPIKAREFIDQPSEHNLLKSKGGVS
jgi:hypothetical protein